MALHLCCKNYRSFTERVFAFLFPSIKKGERMWFYSLSIFPWQSGSKVLYYL